MSQAKTMIRIRQLEKTYDSNRGPVRAVKGLDLDVPEGEFLVLLGPSGCGKTTTLRCVAGLERTDRGSIEIDGEEVDSPASRRFIPPERRDIGMVFQSYAVWPHLNVFENVSLPLTQGRSRVPGAEVKRRVLDALHLVRLDGLENRPVTDLSGGQQQRVALARAIVTRPKVLLMDEPLSNLDARLRDNMRTELKRLTDELGVTTLYVTHDQIEALSLGDRVCVMRDGEILQQGPPEQVYSRPVDLFVAQFVGDMNMVPGTIVERGVAQTPAGVIRFDGDSPPPGEEVTLAMRPEHVILAHDDADDVIEGKLVTRLFIGEAAVLQVEVGKVTISAKVRTTEPLRHNDHVRLRMPREHWNVFPASESRAQRSTHETAVVA